MGTADDNLDTEGRGGEEGGQEGKQNEQTSGTEGASGDGEGAKEKPKEDAPSAVELRLREMERTNAELRRENAENVAFTKAVLGQLQAAAREAGEEPDPNAPDLASRLSENPNQVLEEFFNRRTAPIVQGYVVQQAELAYDLFQERHKDDEIYNDYKGEVTEFMKRIPPQSRQTPAAWEEALGFVKSHHIKEIVQKELKKAQTTDRRAFVEPGSAAGPSGAQRPVLTDEMKKIAKGLQIPEEEYIKEMLR